MIRRWSRCAFLLAVVMLASCVSSEGVQSGAPTQAKSESVPPESALDAAPLHPSGGVPLVGTADQLWLSDFAHIAAYDARTEVWTTSKLPWPREKLDGLVLRPVGEDLMGAALVCEHVSCAETDEGQRPVRVAAFTARLDESGVRVTKVGSRSEPIEDLSNYAVIGSNDDGMTLLVLEDGAGGEVVRIAEGSITATRFTRALEALCPVGHGWVAIERVHKSSEGAVPWSPLPPGWEPNEDDAQRIVAGPELDELGPVTLPEEARPTLANLVGLANACIPDGLALIGAGAAWEYEAGTWTRRPSSMRDGVLNERAGSLVQLGDGSLYGSLPTTSLKRSPGGEWSSMPNEPVLARLGRMTLEYHRPGAGG